MTEFSRDVLGKKLTQCVEALALLKQDRPIGTLEAFRKDARLYHSVCFRFVTMIEALFDVGQVILSSKGKHATSEESMSTLLAHEGFISDDLAQKFSRMYGFRNRLVHAYGTLDDAKVAEYLANHLSDVEELLTVFQKIK